MADLTAKSIKKLCRQVESENIESFLKDDSEAPRKKIFATPKALNDELSRIVLGRK